MLCEVRLFSAHVVETSTVPGSVCMQSTVPSNPFRFFSIGWFSHMHVVLNTLPILRENPLPMPRNLLLFHFIFQVLCPMNSSCLGFPEFSQLTSSSGPFLSFSSLCCGQEIMKAVNWTNLGLLVWFPSLRDPCSSSSDSQNLENIVKFILFILFNFVVCF